MSIVRRFPMRNTTYYTAIALWERFGKNNNQPFTCVQGSQAIHRKLNGALSSMRDTGVLILTTGKKRSTTKNRNLPAPEWKFTESFMDYMQTKDAQQECQCAIDFIMRAGIPAWRY